MGITKKSRTFREVGIKKNPGLGLGVLTRDMEDERRSLKRELLGLGRYPVPSYGGVSTGIIRWYCGG